MNILHIAKALVNAFLLKIFPSLGPKGVIDTQISVYNRLKRKFPNASENDILNSLIISRVKVPPHVAPLKEEYNHYRLLLQNPDKTLEDVIWAIVEYENILSRGEQLHQKLAEVGAQPLAIVEVLQELRNYIKESIKENVCYPNIEFSKLRRDYKSFLWIFFIGIIFSISASFLIANIPDSILIIFSILFNLGWLFYTVKVVIDTFKVFKIIEPSTLEIGISIFLFWLFLLSPLVMGLYVIHLINKYKQMNKINLGDFK